MKYVKPEIEIVKFDTEDIILASGAPTSTVGGVEAVAVESISYLIDW